MRQRTRPDGRQRRCRRVVLVTTAAIALSACDGAPDPEPPGSADLTSDDAAPTEDAAPTTDGDVAERTASGNELTIVLCDDRLCSYPNDEQLDDLRARLAADDEVLSADFESQQEAYDRFLEVFADSPEIVDAVEPDTIPASFRLTLSAEADPDEVAARYEVLPGVDAVDGTTASFGERGPAD